MYLDIPLCRCNFCELIFKMLPLRPNNPAETTNFYWPPEMAVWPKHPKCKNEKRIRFFYFTFEKEKRKRISGVFFVRKFENDKGIRLFVFRSQIRKRKKNSFFVHKFQNEKGIRYSFFVRKFQNEKGKDIHRPCMHLIQLYLCAILTMHIWQLALYIETLKTDS